MAMLLASRLFSRARSDIASRGPTDGIARRTAWHFTKQLKTLWLRKRRFGWIDPGILRDEELELVTPLSDWTEAVMAAVLDPRTQRQAPDMARLTRGELRDFLRLCPRGRQEGGGNNVPTYHFWMRDHSQPQLPIAGAVALRVGGIRDVEMYYGHVGYHVYPPHRGRHFAERSSRLLLSLARRHGLSPVWITCNPDNIASLRTCRRLGGVFAETVEVPLNHPLRGRGEFAKCRFRVDVGGESNVDCRRPS